MCQNTPPAPPTPDYAGAATAQGQANLTAGKQTASLSNPNIISPYGNQSVTWDTTTNPDMPQATVTQTLTPEAQKTLDAQQQVQYGLANLGQQGLTSASNVLSHPFQYSGPGIQTSLPGQMPVNYGPGDGQYGYAHGIDPSQYGSAQQTLDLSNVAKQDVNAGMTGQNAILSRLQPQIQQNAQALAQQLANQGITPGSEAYNNAMRTQGQQQNDLYTQAALQGIGLDQSANQQGFNQALQSAGLYNSGLGQNFGQGVTAQQLTNAAVGQNYGQANTAAGLYNQAQGQSFNQGLQGSQFANTAAQQSLAQQLQLYNQPLNQITALMSGSQIQNPQFQGYSGANVNAAPVFQAAQAQDASNQNLYGIQAAQANAANSGLFGLLGAGAGAIGQAGGFAAMFSDERLKSNIVRVGDHPLGVGVYEYDIFGRRERGVLAQEVERVKPDAVYMHPSGFKMVDYGALE